MIRIVPSAILAGLAICLSWSPTPAQPKPKVDLLLVLAADVSNSIDSREFALQRDGYVSALTDRRVVRAMRSGPSGRIAVTFVEWTNDQEVIVDWTVIDDGASARGFADKLAAKPRWFGDGTGIGGAIRFAAGLIDKAPFVADRHVVDISGDGTSNIGWDPASSRDLVLGKDRDLVINGLVIINQNPHPLLLDHTHPPGGLENYYRQNVIGGPGAFVMVANGFATFGQSLANKMLAEIALR